MVMRLWPFVLAASAISLSLSAAFFWRGCGGLGLGLGGYPGTALAFAMITLLALFFAFRVRR